jgi:hypothetical protein
MHDKNGNSLKVGDKVTVEAVITETHASEEYCNVTLGVGYGQEHGPFNVHNICVVNARQVELIESLPEAAPEEKEFLMQFFEYSHLPPKLQAISKPFGDMARLLMRLPRNAERTTGLRNLLLSKDNAVRALVAK